MAKSKKKLESASPPPGEAAQEFYYTEDTFEIAFMWAKGLQLHHIERSQGNKQRCRAYFTIPASISLVHLKREWADPVISRPFKDVLFRYKQFKDELRRFWASEQQPLNKKAVEEAHQIADEVNAQLP